MNNIYLQGISVQISFFGHGLYKKTFFRYHYMTLNLNLLGHKSTTSQQKYIEYFIEFKCTSFLTFHIIIGGFVKSSPTAKPNRSNRSGFAVQILFWLKSYCLFFFLYVPFLTYNIFI